MYKKVAREFQNFCERLNDFLLNENEFEIYPSATPFEFGDGKEVLPFQNFISPIKQDLTISKNLRALSGMCAKLLANVVYMDKYQKVMYHASHPLTSDFPDNLS